MDAPVTGLRESYRRARQLGFDEQLRECIDQLQNPQLIASEVADAHSCWVEPSHGAHIRVDRGQATDAAEAGRWFYGSRDIFVVRDPTSFTCLAERVESGPDGEDGFEGIDYLAISCTSTPRPILGVVQSGHDATAYPLLLRLLSCLCELGHVPQLDRLDRLGFKGTLGTAPCFDLHLVLWDEWSGDDSVPERTPISQLTRDLAEKAKEAVAGVDHFPPILGDIVCLHMNPARFDGRVRFDWRV